MESAQLIYKHLPLLSSGTLNYKPLLKHGSFPFKMKKKARFINFIWNDHSYKILYIFAISLPGI